VIAVVTVHVSVRIVHVVSLLADEDVIVLAKQVLVVLIVAVVMVEGYFEYVEHDASSHHQKVLALGSMV
jgi:hypothetical protein